MIHIIYTFHISYRSPDAMENSSSQFVARAMNLLLLAPRLNRLRKA